MIKDTGYGLLRYSKKTGKVDMSMTCIGTAQLEMWALCNTTKSKDTIVVDLEDGQILTRYIGTGDFPKIENNPQEFIFDELADALRAEWKKQ